MAKRLRLYDCRVSRLPAVIGKCQSDIRDIANAVNTAQRRLLYAVEAGDESWWGTWAEVAFLVDRTTPLITLPREIARLESVNVCNRPIMVHNQFYEYLEFGNGRMPKRQVTCPGLIQAFTRNNAVTFRDLTSPPQFIRVVLGDAADANRRVLLQGLDNNGNVIYTQDGVNRVTGIFLPLAAPFVQSPMSFNAITGIQKDITVAPVQFFQVDPATGNEILLLTMEPGEETAFYRRYFLNPLPLNCCSGQVPSLCTPSGQTPRALVTAIAKLELIPVVVDTDYLLLQNLEAIIEECQSLRLSEADTPAAKQMAQERHKQAIGMLNGELTHYLGTNKPAVSVVPFGSARLERHKIGTLI